MNKRSRFFLIVVILALLVLMILEPKRYVEASIESLNLVVFKVFPTLFSFFIISRLLTLLGVGIYTSKILSKPLKYCYNAPPIASFVFSLSILSGYPIGAKLISEFYENHIIDKSQVDSLISYTSCSGPVFIIGTVGIGFLDDYKAGVLILFSHILATILNGFIYKNASSTSVASKIEVRSDDAFFNDAVTSSVKAMLQVGGSIIFLNILITFTYHVGIVDLLDKVASAFCIDESILECALVGSVEFTKGIQLISSRFVEKKDIIVAVSTLISFGGLSIYIQSMSFLKKIGVSGRYYLCTKLSQSVFAYVISSILVLAFY